MTTNSALQKILKGTLRPKENIKHNQGGKISNSRTLTNKSNRESQKQNGRN